MTRKYEPRIAPARIQELPTVLDAEQVADVLRIGVERVRKLTQEGALRRLSYSRIYLYDYREVLRFLKESTDDGC